MHKHVVYYNVMPCHCIKENITIKIINKLRRQADGIVFDDNNKAYHMVIEFKATSEEETAQIITVDFEFGNMLKV